MNSNMFLNGLNKNGVVQSEDMLQAFWILSEVSFEKYVAGTRLVLLKEMVKLQRTCEFIYPLVVYVLDVSGMIDYRGNDGYCHEIAVFRTMCFFQGKVLKEMVEKQRSGHFETEWNKQRFSRDVVPELNKGLKLVMFENGVPCANCYAYGGEPRYFNEVYYRFSGLQRFEQYQKNDEAMLQSGRFDLEAEFPTRAQRGYLCKNCEHSLEMEHDDSVELKFDFVDFKTVAKVSARPVMHVSYKHSSKRCANALKRMHLGIQDDTYIENRTATKLAPLVKDFGQIVVCL